MNFNGTPNGIINSKEVCPCCVNDRLTRIRSVNKENMDRKMRDLDKQMLSSNSISLKLSNKRTTQLRRHHQQLEEENKKTADAKRQMQREKQEQERIKRLERDKALQEDAKREAEKEKFNEMCKKSLQKRLLNEQVSYEKETKQGHESEEIYMDHLKKSLNIGQDPVDYKEEVRAALEEQIKEKQMNQLTEVN